MDIHNFLYFALLTFVPTLELRASIPYGIFVLGEDWLLVFALAVFLNFLFGIFLYAVLDFCVKLVTKVQFINEIYIRLVERTQKKADKYVKRFGVIGIGLFIGIPLPGSGVWTGALAAYLLGMRKRDFAVADAIGVLIAGVVVTLVSLGLLNGLGA